MTGNPSGTTPAQDLTDATRPAPPGTATRVGGAAESRAPRAAGRTEAIQKDWVFVSSTGVDSSSVAGSGRRRSACRRGRTSGPGRCRRRRRRLAPGRRRSEAMVARTEPRRPRNRRRRRWPATPACWSSEENTGSLNRLITASGASSISVRRVREVDENRCRPATLLVALVARRRHDGLSVGRHRRVAQDLETCRRAGLTNVVHVAALAGRADQTGSPSSPSTA